MHRSRCIPHRRHDQLCLARPDALDSMLTTRIYRAARPAQEALEELRHAAGTQVCPGCVSALERILPLETPELEAAALLAAS